MQTSLRSTNYQQYYEFGPTSTLDCSGRLVQQHAEPNEQTASQPPVQIHHRQPQHTTHHNQQLIESQAVSNANFGHQSLESNHYLSPNLHRRGDQLTASTNGVHESMIVYQDEHQHQHQHHFHQISDSVKSNDDNNNQEGHEEALDLETRESVYHQQQGCVDIQRQLQQQQHQQQTYQTVYYEPINFDGCAIEAQENSNQISEQQNQTFVPNQLISFINSSQQSDEECGVYFQYQQAHVPNDEPLLSNEQPQPELTLPLVEQNQQQRQQQTSFYEGEQTSVTNKHQAQVYQTLETITNTYDLNHHHQQQHFDQQVSLSPTNNDLQQQHQQQQYEQLQQQSQQTGIVKSESPYQLHTNLHHHNHHHNHIQFGYIHSESTGASTITQPGDHSTANTASSPAAASTTSSSESEESFASTLTRDEKRAREANIPLTYKEIVNLSIDQFNEQLAKHNLSESQLTLIKDIRRRGKNKVAAQSCRKRKMEQIDELEHEVYSLTNKRRSLSCECSQLIKDHGNLIQEYDKIYTILQGKMQASQQNLQ